ncbi:MAG: glutamine--fructose-6-phosphate transaminase (isomerizing) [Nitrososphaerota archaeon]|nr:glutamine--fructose-6-phosphate transaminase (isomerizing) [Nitrososphaerota archaeon]
MCSIIGYRGQSLASQKIVQGLKKMEYRGYDSVGVATIFGKEIHIRKGVGRVDEVNQYAKLDSLPGNIGIGHTRWATHGGVTDANAHPHSSNSGKLAIVHNGIIENYIQLKEFLIEQGFHFKSQTDSEVIANLIQLHLERTGDEMKAVLSTVAELKGSYAFIIMFQNGTMVAARYHEPLILGISEKCSFVSSDVLGFVDDVEDAIFLRDGELAIIDSLRVQIFDFNGIPVQPGKTKLARELVESEKGDFAHFTLKEIFQQPSTILRVDEKNPELDLFCEYISKAKHLYFIGSGTSYNAALVGSHLLHKYAGIRAEPLVASELPHLPHSFDKYSVVIALSQSGESADVLNAVRIAKRSGAKVISIVNVMTSSLVRESSLSIGLNCGPEIGVAATKSFTSQLSVLYKLAAKLSITTHLLDFNRLAEGISQILSDSASIREASKEIKFVSDVYVLGRGIHFPIAIEGALKIKEITYIHAEGISGGELKHGPLALMHDGVYAIVINPDDSTYADTLTGVNEIKARGARIIGISDVPNPLYDYWIKIPKVGDSLYPVAEVVPLQLLAYYTAIERNADPDYPRNLAKCVTVN